MFIALLSGLLVTVLSAAAARPLIMRAFSVPSPSRTLPVNSLALLIGPILFLLLFSLGARVLPSYELSAVCALAVIYSARLFGSNLKTSGSEHDEATQAHGPLRAEAWSLVPFGLLLVGAYTLRTFWPAIHWENSVARLGVERLFNLSLQQSFLYSEQWPPENLWLHGEPLSYHVFLRAAPGLASHFARELFGSPMSGHYLYLLFDAWYLCLLPLSVSVFCYSLLQTLVVELPPRRTQAFCLLLGALVFFAPHGAALTQGLFALWQGSTVDFWSVQHEVVKGTVNFFPFVLLLSGESHSYAQAPFLQVVLWGTCAYQLCIRWSLLRAVIIAALAASLAMAHPASALLAAIGLGTAVLFFCGLTVLREGPRAGFALVLRWLSTGLLGLVLYLPAHLATRSPELRWVTVTDSLASPALDFIRAQAAPLAVLGLLLIAAVLSSPRSSLRGSSLVLTAGSIAVAGLSAFLLERPAIGITVLLLGAVSMFSSALLTSLPRALLTMILGTAAAWVVPEILVSDWASDNRTDWVRFNTVMRFWLDGYALIPLFGAIVLAPHVLADRIRARRTLVGLTGLLLISVLSLIPLLRDRFQRTPESASTNGAAFLKVEHPTDWMIIDYLSRVAGPVVLGEVCGTGSTPLNPYHYGMPGRLSAFSGRPSVCGWGRHTWMFQQRFSFGPHAGENIWSSFLAYEQALETVYRGTDPAALTGALRYLQSRSITHLAFGELERQLYGDQDLELLAKRLGAAVVFSPSPHAGVIRLSQVSTELAGLSDPLKPPAPWGPPDQHLTRQVAIHRRVH